MKILKKESKNASHAPILSQMTDKRPMMEKNKQNRIDFLTQLPK